MGRVPRAVPAMPAEAAIALLGDRVDASTAYTCFARCVAAPSCHVIADLSSTTFMDRLGYEALMSARATIEQRGGTLELRGASGQPSRLMRCIPRRDEEIDGRPSVGRPTGRGSSGASRPRRVTST